jgi:hypothetical protein
MRKQNSWLLVFIVGIFLTSGCAFLVAGGAAVGAGSGTYYYINGELKTDYYHPFDAVWSACEKTVADMRGIDVDPVKEIGTGTISAMIENDKVQFKINYKAKNVTTVAIRVGYVGNKLSSQLLHDKISENLAKKQ